jgi:hypothetical protein
VPRSKPRGTAQGADRKDVNWRRASTGFEASVGFWGSAEFGFDDGFPPEHQFGVNSGFDFGFGFGGTETPIDPNSTRCHPYSYSTNNSLY